jgi:mannitol-1-phosphate 5-dehydrogenase
MLKKLVLFGAGKIGRSFIAQLFSNSGYQVIFIDIDKRIIEALNSLHSYEVVIKHPYHDESLFVNNVSGIDGKQRELVIEAVALADVLATSVGINGLKHIMPVLAAGIEKRFSENNNNPLDIIIAENMRNAAGFFSEQLQLLLPASIPVEKLVGLVETSIGKMVPIMPDQIVNENPLIVYAEPYNTLILDKKAFKNPIPEVAGLAPKENMKAWVDRKSFIHNFGHAATAYFGYCVHPTFTYLYQVLNDKKVYQRVYKAMQQAAAILRNMYPHEFTEQHTTDHIVDLLSRFANKALGDTIYRVGCDLMRKLSPEDRVAGLLRIGNEMKMPVNQIENVLACGFRFLATDENGACHPADVQFQQLLSEKGIRQTLTDVCGLQPTMHSDSIQHVEQLVSEIEKREFVQL